ncbi:MAG TPA: MFS transporter [Acidimicrobiales bacterium]|nr:MFS transporter [Acidimicrobiales bacterium]
MTSGGSSGPIAPADIEPTPKPPFAMVVMITLTGIMGTTLVTPVLPDIIKDFGARPSAVGLLVSAAAAPGILMAPVIGVLSDRYGRREVVVPCLAVFGLSGGLAVFAPNYGVLLALRLLQGVGSAGLVNMAVVIIGDHWTGLERARMIGRNVAILTASVVVLPPVGGLLATIGGWRAAFVPFWLGLVVAGFVAVRLPRSHVVPRRLRDQLRAAGPYLRSPAVVGAMVGGFFVFVLIFGLFLTLMPVHLADDFGAEAGVRGLIFGLPAVTSTISALSLPRWVRRFGARRVVALAFVMLTIAFGLIAAADTLPLVMVAVLVYGFGEGVLIPSFQDAVAGAAPASSRGIVVAMFVGLLRGGQTLGPFLASRALAGPGAQWGFGAGAVVAGALVLASRWLVHPHPVLDDEPVVAPVV